MRTEDWLAQGNLGEAIAQARQDLVNEPGNLGQRFLLFELLILTEEFDQAEEELHYAVSAEPSFAENAEFYLGILRAERLRYNFINKAEGVPQALLPPPAYGEKFIQAVCCLAEANITEAELALGAGWEQVPQLSGNLDDQPFTEIRDADDLLGPFLEAIVPNGYYWVPFEQIEQLRFQPKRGYPDTIWLPAYIEMKGGVKGNLWIPSLYSGTGSKDDALRLGNLTTWEYPSPHIGRVYGQRDLKTDKVLKGIRQVSTISIFVESA